MTPPSARFVVLFLGTLIAVAGLSGCPSGTSQMPEEENRIKTLSILFGQYTSQHRGQTPPDEKSFKQFIAAMNKEALASLKVDPTKVDELFVSPRDNQPYGISYKAKSSMIPDASGRTAVIVWEKVGSGGKHYVADGLGKVELLSDDEFKKRVPNPG